MNNSLTRQRAEEILARFKHLNLVVLGDLMVDAYIWGKVSRISPEAPIPVVEVVKEEARPGGAANVGLNMLALGAKVSFAGIVGGDDAAALLRDYLCAKGANTDAIVTAPGRPTTIKTRVIAQQQQMLRIDKEHTTEVPAAYLADLEARVASLLPGAGGLVFSDYNKGVLQAGLVERMTTAAMGRVITVDPKPQNMHLFKRASLVTPNKREAEGAVGFPLRTEEDVRRAGERLRGELQLGATLITRGEEGMSLYDGSTHVTIPTQAKLVFDVTGAGDTVISVATLALCAGATYQEAAILANIAAGITVAHVGVYAVSAEEVLAQV